MTGPAIRARGEAPKVVNGHVKTLLKSDEVSASRADEKAGVHASLAGEYGNIFLLLVLYTLQGIPLGLFGFVSMEVKDLFKDSFSEQGTFMLAAWPFSLKLLWAPLVDACYFRRIGRRKSWMVPAQLIIGVVLLCLAPRIEGLFAAKDVSTLTVVFFVLYLLCATQDIAVDGWALTMLRAENAGYASTCNAVGQTIGCTVGLMVPMGKMVSLDSFLYFWGTVFVGVTLAVALLKREKTSDEDLVGIKEAYITMYKVVSLRPVQLLTLHFLTRAIAFMPAEAMAPGILQDQGFAKEQLASIKAFITPLEIALPWILSRFTAGPRPLDVVLMSYLPRVFLTLAVGLLLHGFGSIQTPVPTWIYITVVGFMILQGVLSNAMFVSHMAFIARVSDPAIGGTYMTLLNTVANLGNVWASTFCLKASDHIKASTGYSGFYVLCGVCTQFGVVWFLLFRGLLKRLQDRPISDWRAFV